METVQVSQTDRFLRERIFEPIATHIPASIKPNSITIVTPIVALLSFCCAAAAPSFSAGWALGLRLAAACFMLTSMLTDHLDGLHARRTKQTSRFGEVFDHWLDAFHVPLASAGLALTLQADAWAVWALIASNSMIYNAQLVLYHRTHKFVYAPMGGASAQVTLALGYVAFGVLLFLVPTEPAWIRWGVTGVCIAVLIGQLRQVVFYIVHLKRHVLAHAYFVLLSAGVGALYGFGAINTAACVSLLIAVSARITGAFVMRAVLREPYSGFDAGLAFGLLTIGAVARWAPSVPLGPVGLLEVIPFAVAGYLILHNLVDFLRTGAHLHSEDEAIVFAPQAGN